MRLEEAFARYPQFFPETQLERVATAVADAVAANCVAPQIPRPVLEDLVARCCDIIVTLCGDLKWPMVRALDHLEACLRADLAGAPLPISETRKTWITKAPQ